MNEPTSPNPTFTAPETREQEDVTFRFVVTDDEGTVSEPDQVKITVNPTRPTTSQDVDDSRTMSDEIMGIINNSLNIANSIVTADRLSDYLSKLQ